MNSAGRTASQMPRILIYALGNYTHPGTRHSLGQFILGGLAKELGLPLVQTTHGGPTKASIGHGRLEEKKVNGWTGWIGAGAVDLVEVKRDIFGRAIVRKDSSDTVDSNDAERASMTIATPREPMNLSGRNLSNLIRTLSTASTPPDAKSTKQPSLSPPTVLFLHDSLEIPSSTFKRPTLKATTEGHNGLRSCSSSPLIYPTSTPNTPNRGTKFLRLSLGIGRPGDGARFSAGSVKRSKSGDGEDIAKWVLGKLGSEERLFWEGEGVRGVAREVKEWARGL